MVERAAAFIPAEVTAPGYSIDNSPRNEDR